MARIGGKQNSARKFSDGGPRPDLRPLRQKEAQERQSERDELGPKEQLKKLDQMLGVGVGATKERIRLDWQIKTGKKAKGRASSTTSENEAVVVAEKAKILKSSTYGKSEAGPVAPKAR